HPDRLRGVGGDTRGASRTSWWPRTLHGAAQRLTQCGRGIANAACCGPAVDSVRVMARERCMVRPPARRMLCCAAKNAILPQNLAFAVGEAAEVSVRVPMGRPPTRTRDTSLRRHRYTALHRAPRAPAHASLPHALA